MFRPLLLLVPVSFLACQSRDTAVTAPADTPPATASSAPAGSENAREVLGNMDLSADPCQDFFRYACGGWLDGNEIPGDQSRWGRFNVLREENKAVLREILESGEGVSPRSVAYYRSCMDEAAIEERGAGPLAPVFEEIDTVKNAASLAKVLGSLHQRRVGALFRVGASADYKKPDMEIGHVYQGGLGMPDRDYYLEQDDRMKGLRAAYETHVATMLGLAGYEEPDAKDAAKRILAFETKLAEAAMPRTELRNPEKRYNKIDRKGLAKTAPQIKWDAYFEATGHGDVQHLSVTPPSYFAALGKLVKKTKPATIRDYLKWQAVTAAADLLSRDFVDENFAFFGQKLSGQRELAPRWKRCVESTDHALGEDLGRGFVDRRFAGDSKDVALDMIQRIEAAFEAALPSLAWMDDTTRARAQEKEKAVVNKIGYPDEWRDYSRLEIGNDYFANAAAAMAFEYHRRMSNIGKPVDEKEWHMTPPTVNAYYNATNNEMVFPAGILQPPFFHRDFLMAQNFGGIGMVMGHELTHGFDDQGRKFDGSGQMRQWWEDEAVSAFEERAACVDKLYSGYEVQPGVALNGKLTLGENIADLGGVKEAHAAYRKWVDERGDEPPLLQEISNEQLFFVSAAQIWCGKETPEAERMLVKTDSHSRPKFRVNGPMSQSPAFWAAFQCAEGTPMHPNNACEVW